MHSILDNHSSMVFIYYGYYGKNSLCSHSAELKGMHGNSGGKEFIFLPSSLGWEYVFLSHLRGWEYKFLSQWGGWEYVFLPWWMII